MATQIVEIRAVDKTRQALGRVDKRLKGIGKSTQGLERGFGRLQSKILAVGAALATGFGIKKILSVSSQVEQLELKLKFLFKSAEEGGKAFQALTSYASKVPFELEQIAAASGNLAVVAKDADHLSELLVLTGNVAVFMGGDFRLAGEQVQRAMSGGIAAAEIFREKGIKAMAGFKDGVNYNVAQSQKKLMEAFGPGGTFGRAANAMATTWTGVLSMISDKVFQFTLAVGKAGGLFEFSKGIAGVINKAMGDNEKGLNKFAANVGNKIIEITQKMAIGTAQLIDMMSPIFKFVRSGINGMVSFMNMLPGTIKAIGIIGFLMLGLKGKLLVLAIGAVLDNLGGMVDDFMKSIEAMAGFVVDKLNWLIDKANALNPFKEIPQIPAPDFGSWAAPINAMSDKLKKMFDSLTDSTNIKQMGEMESKIRDIIKQIEIEMALNAEAKRQLDEELKKMGIKNQAEFDFRSLVEQSLGEIQKQTDSINGLTKEQRVSLELEKKKYVELFATAGITKEVMDAKKEEIRAALMANEVLKETVALEKQRKIEAEAMIESATKFRVDYIQKETEALQTVANNAIAILNTQKETQLITEQDFANSKLAIEALLNQEILDMEAARLQKQEDMYMASLEKRLTANQGAIAKHMSAEDKEFLKKKGREEKQKEINRTRIEFEKKSEMEKYQFGIGQAKNFFAALGKENKAAFAAAKAMAIAEAVINTYQGATKALASYPPPFNFIAMAAVIAAGFAQVSAIRAQTAQRGGTVLGGATALVGEDGPELIVPKQSSTVIPREVADAVGGISGGMGGEVNVNFNITTVDARDFDQLLVERRGTIVGIINNAMNQQGKVGVTA